MRFAFSKGLRKLSKSALCRFGSAARKEFHGNHRTHEELRPQRLCLKLFLVVRVAEEVDQNVVSRTAFISWRPF